MQLLEDSDGNRTSIPVEGIKEFVFAPHRNMIEHTSFPGDQNVFPRITFMDLPSRQILHMHTAKDSQELRLYIHPQGNYVACMNQFLVKKTLKYSVELFDTKNFSAGSIP